MPSLNRMREVGANDFNTKTLDKALQERAADPKPSKEELRTMEKGEAKQREIEDFEKISKDFDTKGTTTGRVSSAGPTVTTSPWARKQNPAAFVFALAQQEPKVESLEDHIVANYAFDARISQRQAYEKLRAQARWHGKSIEDYFRTSRWGEGSVAIYKKAVEADYGKLEQRVVKNYMIQGVAAEKKITSCEADLVFCGDLEDAQRNALEFIRALDN